MWLYLSPWFYVLLSLALFYFFIYINVLSVLCYIIGEACDQNCTVAIMDMMYDAQSLLVLKYIYIINEAYYNRM